MQLTELRCKNCGAPLKPENVSVQLAIARCPHCDALFALGHTSHSPAAAAAVERLPVPMPKRFQVTDLGNRLEITHSWFTPLLFFLVFFCIVWNGFMIVWHLIAIFSGFWLMSLFGMLHTAVGVGLTYATLAGFINRTVIRVDQGMLEIAHGPLPWPGNKSLPAYEIEQVYCQETVHHGKNGTSRTYSVQLILKGNRRETLVKNLTDCDQAIYIEQELERFLNIEDRPVRGELPR
jgi:hypothetical protein